MPIDAFKREISKDSFAIRNLGLQESEKAAIDAILGTAKPFQIGKIDQEGRFQPLNIASTLKESGIKYNDILWVNVIDVNSKKEEKSPKK